MTSHTSDPLVGQILGNYAILGRIGTGGMAIVYKAKHLQFGRIVALKTLRTQDPVVMERFAREIRTLALLKHPNIVEAIDCLQAASGQTFLVMEYVEGLTLEEFIKAEGCIKNEDDIASVITQVCDALDHAHKQRIIHRDLKPPNIVLLEQDGKTMIKVLDFGIAKLQDELQKLTTVGQAMGSPLYMSPEQCTGQELSPASDIYTLGIVSYQMICGRHPYESSSVVEIMTNHCDPNKFPESITDLRPDIAGVIQLNQVIFRMIATDPNKRFQSTDEVKKALNAWIQSTKTRDTETSATSSEETKNLESPKARRQARKAKQDSNLSRSVHKLSAFKKSEAVTKTVKLNQREVKKAEKNAHTATKKTSAGRLIAMVIVLPIVVLAAITALALNFEGVKSMFDNVTNNASASHDSNTEDSSSEEHTTDKDGGSSNASSTTSSRSSSPDESDDMASGQESGSEAGSENPGSSSNESGSGSASSPETSSGESLEKKAKSNPEMAY